jgi:hypothetical protein
MPKASVAWKGQVEVRCSSVDWKSEQTVVPAILRVSVIDISKTEERRCIVYIAVI